MKKDNSYSFTSYEFQDLMLKSAEVVERHIDAYGLNLSISKSTSTESLYISIYEPILKHDHDAFISAGGIGVEEHDAFRFSSHSKEKYHSFKNNRDQPIRYGAYDAISNALDAFEELLEQIEAKAGGELESAVEAALMDVEQYLERKLHQKHIFMQKAQSRGQRQRELGEKALDDAVTLLSNTLNTKSGELYQTLRHYNVIKKDGSLIKNRQQEVGEAVQQYIPNLRKYNFSDLVNRVRN